MFLLDSSVSLASLVFTVKAPELVPPVVRTLVANGQKKPSAPATVPGFLIQEMSRLEGCSLRGLTEGLAAHSYGLCHAQYSVKQDTQHRRIFYHIFRYEFAQVKYLDLSDEFLEVRDAVVAELQHLLEETVWTLRMTHNNPFFSNGKEVKGYRAVDMNFNGRHVVAEGHVPRHIVCAHEGAIKVIAA